MKSKIEYIFNPIKLVRPFGDRCFFNWMADDLYLKLIYRAETGKKLNLKNPTTFNEKLQWLKINNRKNEFSIMADKYRVREYISKKIGEKYLIPLIGVYDNENEIPWDNLPESFVIKCTHGSNCNIICKCKEELDIEAAKGKLNRWLKHSWFNFGREWVYKNITPRIIIEKYMVDESNVELKDYKMFCFDGKVKMIQVDFGRFINHKRNIYRPNWELTELSIKYPRDEDIALDCPQKLDEMIELGEILSKNIPHVRVDFYSINNRLYFGELTFYQGSGFEHFYPDKYETIFGDWINLDI